ncbi:hypothetical protein SAMN05428988_1329 [Chitinophaga sp. YR573]|uniref:hypothetical protein n=1 Tax=Chitinophaga sp. YR573 TaxID=1881040 RepID=UPI0008C7B8AB|nr:hypothetical protein [Chitinophaga sp. YR573]SEW02107.1 hypothetical protein SAMN05428988_1329 [Chitinophaga sp. YR573]
MMRGHRSIFISLFENDVQTIPSPAERKGRSEALILKRNELLICRYYYLVKISALQYQSALTRLENEFFLSERTIIDILAKNRDITRHFLTTKPSLKYLRDRYPSMTWN